MSNLRKVKKKGRGRPRSRSQSAPPVLSSPKKRKRWTEASMQAALESVQSGVNVYRAAKEHGVPTQTLRDRVSGRVIHGTKPGPKPYLSSAEEKELTHFLVDVSKAGYGKSRAQVKRLAEAVARDKGKLKGKKISDGWYSRFMERQPHLALRTSDATANVRMDCLNKETMAEYFNLLESVLTDNDLLSSPGQIYNVDETGVPLDHRPPKVVTKRGQRKVRCRTSGNRSQITVIGCVSACGQAIPPFVIFDAKSLNMEWRKNEISGTSYGLSDKGWVDTELFKGWLTDHLLKYAVGARPLLVLLDGHSSHYQPDLIRYAKEHDIILFCLPPHTTHESQPLDVSVFKSLKKNWQDVCHEYMQSNPGKVVTKYQFSDLLNKAWSKTMTPSTICAGFKKCGIFPFNPKAIDCSISVDNPGAMLTQAQGGGSHDVDNEVFSGDSPVFSGDSPVFSGDSPVQEQQFQERYDEGYDLPESEYLRWIRIHQPEYVLTPDPDDTLTSMFSFVEPHSPLSIDWSVFGMDPPLSPGTAPPTPGSTSLSPGTVPCTPGSTPGTAPRTPGSTPGTAPRTPGSTPGTAPRTPGSTPGTAPRTPGSTPGTAPRTPGSTPGTAPRTPGSTPGTAPRTPGSTPGTAPRTPGSTPGTAPRAPGSTPGTAPRTPGSTPGTAPRTPGSTPGTAPRTPGSTPGTAPRAPGSTPGTAPRTPGSTPGTAPRTPGSTPGTAPRTPGSTPGTAPRTPGSTPGTAPRGPGSTPGTAPRTPGSTPGTAPRTPGSTPGTAPRTPGSTPGTAPRTPGSTPGTAPRTPGSTPGTAPRVPGSTPGTAPRTPGSTPGTAPRTPGSTPGTAPRTPGSTPGTAPRTPGSTPGTAPRAPGFTPGTAPRAPGSTPGTAPRTPGSTPGTAPRTPGSTPGTAPRTPGSTPGTAPRTPGSTPGTAPRAPGSTPCTAPRTPGSTPLSPGMVPRTPGPTSLSHGSEGHTSPACGSAGPEHSGELRYISKYLVQFVPATKPKDKTSAAKRVSGARVLTSAKCAAILQEREEKKRKEQEEKEQRKADRERKKAEKEEAVKKKADERAKKAEEKAKKAEEKARKAETLAQARSNRAKSTSTTVTKKRKTTNDSSVASTSSAAPPPATSSVGLDLEPSININECCVCYRTFEEDQHDCTGLEWVECVCQRWLHEDCVCDVVLDSEGRELLCPYCVV